MGCYDGLGRVRRGLGDDDSDLPVFVSSDPTSSIYDTYSPVTTPSPDCAWGGVYPYCNANPISSASSVPGSVPVSGGGSAPNALASALASTANLLNTRLGVPQLNPGQSITVTPGGYQVTQQPAGYAATGASLGLSTTNSLLPLLLIGGVVLFVVMGKK
jgi:hypothetical protein